MPGERRSVFDTLKRHPLKVFSQVARDPLDAFYAFQGEFLSRFEGKYSGQYTVDPNWEADLAALLGIPKTFAEEEFPPLWREVIESLRARGFKVGPFSFHAWNDGDAGLVRAIWSVIRHTRPKVVVETGVAHGVTSRFILEALARNDFGGLWSIDLPPVNPETRREVGIAVDNAALRDRWSYIAGTSRRRLPGLLSQLGQVDLFIHDSMHSARNVAFEMDLAWKHLSPGGVIVVDDIDINPSFKMFAQRHPQHRSFICTAEPISPDTRRFNQKGLFGIIVKSATSPGI
jgi:predicted O-methyltransferase YrrM